MMYVFKIICSVLTVVFGVIGMINVLPYDIALPVMFLFLGLSLLANAKECYDKGAKQDAIIFSGVAIFVYAITAYNIISRIL